MTDKISDPLEKLLAKYLPNFEHEKNGLDFYLTDEGIYIEVKQFHTDRVNEQLKRDKNIILVQGIRSAEWLAEILRDAYIQRRGKPSPPAAQQSPNSLRRCVG